MERKKNPPLLNHLLQHFHSQWGFLEEPRRLRELEVCICLGGRGGHMPWSHIGCRLPLELFSMTACNLGLNSAAKWMNCSSHQHRTHLGQTRHSALWGQYICRITYPSLCRRNALFRKSFFSPFPPKLLFPSGNGLSTSLKNRSDLLGNPWYHKRVAVRMQMNWRALKNPLASAAEVEKGQMMDGAWLSAERFCSFYGCQWLMYFIFCFLYCRLSNHPQARGRSLGTHFILPLGKGCNQLFCTYCLIQGKHRLAQLDGALGGSALPMMAELSGKDSWTGKNPLHSPGEMHAPF